MTKKTKDLRSVLIEVLQNFFNEEKGNRITSNNIDGLMGKILRVIEPYEYITTHEEKSKKEN